MFKAIKSWNTEDGPVTIHRNSGVYVVRWPTPNDRSTSYEKNFNWPDGWNKAQKFAAERAREIEAKSMEKA